MRQNLFCPSMLNVRAGTASPEDPSRFQVFFDVAIERVAAQAAATE